MKIQKYFFSIDSAQLSPACSFFQRGLITTQSISSHLFGRMNLDLYFYPLSVSWVPGSSSWLQDVSTWVFHCQLQLKAQKGKLTIFLFKLASLLNFKVLLQNCHCHDSSFTLLPLSSKLEVTSAHFKFPFSFIPHIQLVNKEIKRLSLHHAKWLDRICQIWNISMRIIWFKMMIRQHVQNSPEVVVGVPDWGKGIQRDNLPRQLKVESKCAGVTARGTPATFH